jgi:hypothetical protein
MRDCDQLLAAVLRGDPLADAERAHVDGCPRCGALAPDLALLAPDRRVGAPAPPSALTARVLLAAQPLLDGHARTAQRARATLQLDGRQLATALLPAILLFPLIVLADVVLLRSVHGVLATLLPATLTTYLVASYATLLAALVCLTFGAIPLIVQRQGTASWKEGHV